MAQDLQVLAARGFDEFVRECPSEMLTALETSLVQKGVMLHKSKTQYWTPENHFRQGRLSQPETGAILRLNSVVTSLRRSREKGLSFNGEDDMIDHGAAM